MRGRNSDFTRLKFFTPQFSFLTSSHSKKNLHSMQFSFTEIQPQANACMHFTRREKKTRHRYLNRNCPRISQSPMCCIVTFHILPRCKWRSTGNGRQHRLHQLLPLSLLHCLWRICAGKMHSDRWMHAAIHQIFTCRAVYAHANVEQTVDQFQSIRWGWIKSSQPINATSRLKGN